MSLIKLNVKTNKKNYPIVIGKNILDKLKNFLRENSINFNQCLIVVDSNISKKLIKKILDSLPKKKIRIQYFNTKKKKKNQKRINKI